MLENHGQAVVMAAELTKIYHRGREEVRALDHVSFQLASGEFVAVVGASGSGKSTLLNLLGCMDVPTSGSLRIAGEDVERFSDRALTEFRRSQVGFIFQHFGLIPTLTVEENIALPASLSHRKDPSRVQELIQRVGLEHRREHRPAHLSGGEMQRTAIARALVNHPKILLADEPTGNLDSATGDKVLELLQELHHDGLTIIVATHNTGLAAAANREIRLQDGKLVGE